MSSADDRREKLRLTLVVGRVEAAPRNLKELAAEAFAGGAGALQLREKGLSDKALYHEALDLADFCRNQKRLLIINDRVDLALAVEADGVHLGQGDLPARAAARLLPKSKILGVSVQTVEAAREALAAGADYLGVGAIFPTGSKDDAEVIDPGELKGILALGAPTVAIGGLTVANSSRVWAMGFTGLAVISALTAAENPKSAAAGLLESRQPI